jgi:hypothetical protein
MRLATAILCALAIAGVANARGSGGGHYYGGGHRPVGDA